MPVAGMPKHKAQQGFTDVPKWEILQNRCSVCDDKNSPVLKEFQNQFLEFRLEPGIFLLSIAQGVGTNITGMIGGRSLNPV